MRTLGRVLALLAVVLTLAAPDAAAAATRICTVTDPRIDEASGLAPRSSDGRFVYVQNDSGDSARFFAVDTRTGRTAAVYTVPGARNVDWEDLAVAPDPTGHPSVWLADTGDNDATRSEIDVYRVPEPAAPTWTGASAAAPVVATARPTIWRLAYPDGPQDAESLAVDPLTHRAYIVTKSVLGGSVVYELPAAPSAARQTLTRVGAIDLRQTGTPGGPFPPIGQVTATGAAISAAGTIFVLRTYTDAYLWPVRGGDVAAALRGPPTHVALPAQAQGEGIAVVGRQLWLDTEGVGQPILAVPVPPAVLAAAAPPSSSSAAPTSSTPGPGQDGKGNGIGWGVLLLLACGVMVAVFAARRRGPRRRDDDIPTL